MNNIIQEITWPFVTGTKTVSILQSPIHKMLEDPEVKEEKRTIRNSHSNLEIIFGNVWLIVCLEKETKGGTIKLFYLIMKADKYFQFYKLFYSEFYNIH
jgi:hypothetical protein